MYKKLSIFIFYFSIIGCATNEQKLEKDYLRSIHKAERKIKLGQTEMALGAAITARGLVNIKAGKEDKKIASIELMKSLGLQEGETTPVEETPVLEDTMIELPIMEEITIEAK